MGVSQGISLRFCAVALATVFVVFLNMEVGQGQAPAPGNCNTNAIVTALTPCLNQTTIPSPGSPCCKGVSYVIYTIKPSDECICDLVKEYNLPPEVIAEVITSCVGASHVPGCL